MYALSAECAQNASAPRETLGTRSSRTLAGSALFPRPSPCNLMPVRIPVFPSRAAQISISSPHHRSPQGRPSPEAHPHRLHRHGTHYITSHHRHSTAQQA